MKICIIGNGAAGNQAAETIRKHNDQCEIYMFAEEEQPFYSACALPDVLSGWLPAGKAFIKNLQSYERAGIYTVFGQKVENVDIKHKYLLADGKEYLYDQLIIATGSRAVIPPVKNSHLPGNFVVKTFQDVEFIKKYNPCRVVVVGGGNTGVETAIALHTTGCQVSLIEMQQHLMSGVFDSGMAEMISDIMLDNGIAVYTGEEVVQVEGNDSVEGIKTINREIECDTIVWAVGVRPNIELADKTGIEIGSLGGILVNQHMQTSIPGIYACGDCVQTYDMISGESVLSLLWSSAKKQAITAAYSCLGKEKPFAGAISLVVDDIFGIVFWSVGLTLKHLQECQVKIIEEEGYYRRFLIKNNRLVGVQGTGTLEDAGAVFSLIKRQISLDALKAMLNKHGVACTYSGYSELVRILKQ